MAEDKRAKNRLGDNKFIRSKTPDEKRASVTVRYNQASVEMLSELEKMLLTIRWQRECIEKSQIDGMGYKQMTVDKNTVNAISVLARALTTLTDSKIKLDKHFKHIEEDSTPEEDLNTCITFIKQLDQSERSKVLRDLVSWHSVESGKKADLDVQS